MVSGLLLTGYPIRISADLVVLADPRSFSQLTASFFASQSLGIHRTPLITFYMVHLYGELLSHLKYVNDRIPSDSFT